MKPFNLERALAGDSVVTRDGRVVEELHHFKTAVGTFPITVVINGARGTRTLEGKAFGSFEHNGDLFMASTQVTKWVNIYARHSSYLTGGTLYDSEEAAIAGGRSRLTTVPVTFEV